MDTGMDPRVKKTDGILEQLGLHPSQLQAQQHLAGVFTQMAANRPPEGVDPLQAQVDSELEKKRTELAPKDQVPKDPASEASIAAGQGPQLSSWAKLYEPQDLTVPGPNYSSTNPFTASGVKPEKPSALVDTGTPPEPQPAEDSGVSTLPGPTPSGRLINQKANSQIDQSQDELARLQATGSGISQIKNPFLRTLATVGDVAGKALFPSIERAIPGTEGHHSDLINAELGRIKANQGIEKDEAELKNKEADTRLKGTKPDEWSLSSEFQGPNGEPIEINKATGETRLAMKDSGVKPIDKTKPFESQLPIPDVGQVNKGLESRWQVLNPDKPLPPQFTLKEGATQRDFNNIDKILEAEEKARGTVEQQRIANEFRQQTLDLLRAAQGNKEERTGMDMVIGQDANGNLVAVGSSDVKRYGLNNLIKPGAPQVEKIINARNLLPLFNNKEERDPGLLQMVEILDRNGKLGPLASRWNEFMAGTWGGGDPQYEAFRTKLGLSNTALMNVHVGNRGGAYMLEHFENLVNGKKMSGPTLRSGLFTEFNYIKHRAMMPGQTAVNSNAMPAPGATEQKPPLTGGKTITRKRAEQLAEENGMTVDEVIKDAKDHGVTVK
jgi:hypothetical protein